MNTINLNHANLALCSQICQIIVRRTMSLKRSTRRGSLFIAGCAILAASFVIGATDAYSQTVSWQASSGNWSIGSNWDGGVPGSNATAYIVNGGTADVVTNGDICGTLWLGSGAGNGTVSMTAGGLSAAYEYVANRGTCSFTQSGGTNSVSSEFDVGFNSGASGIYSLSGGSIFAGLDYIGYYGNGGFTQSGGAHAVANNLYLGYNSGSTGSYNLSGSGFLSASSVIVGAFGTGSFMQSGGTHAVAMNMFVGSNSGGSGTYNLSAGNLFVGINEEIGEYGNGSFSQTGGTHSVSSALYLGQFANSNGSYTLGSGLLSTPSEIIGNLGSGVFTQTGGTNAVAVDLVLGGNSGSSGTYNLNAGSLFGGQNEYISYSGNGSFTQSGGTNSTTILVIGVNAGSSGTYNLQGGLLQTSLGIATAGGAATFNFGGGTLGAINPFFSSNNMNLSGVGGNATIDTTGGSISLLGDLTGPGGLNKVGTGILLLSGNNTYSGGTVISGGTLQIGSNATLGTQSATGPSNALLTVIRPGVLDTHGYKVSIGALSGNGTIDNGNVGSSDTLYINGPAASTFSGTMQNTGGIISVDYGSSAMLTMTGLTLLSGFWETESGVVAMPSGLFSVPTQYVGYGNRDNGTFAQSGGTNSASSTLNIGFNPGSSGSYNFSGAACIADFTRELALAVTELLISRAEHIRSAVACISAHTCPAAAARIA
jgi:autotransporter-associated beta strand protein